jgi:hypothetical protein
LCETDLIKPVCSARAIIPTLSIFPYVHFYNPDLNYSSLKFSVNLLLTSSHRAETHFLKHCLIFIIKFPNKVQRISFISPRKNPMVRPVPSPYHLTLIMSAHPSSLYLDQPFATPAEASDVEDEEGSEFHEPLSEATDIQSSPDLMARREKTPRKRNQIKKGKGPDPRPDPEGRDNYRFREGWSYPRLKDRIHNVPAKVVFDLCRAIVRRRPGGLSAPNRWVKRRVACAFAWLDENRGSIGDLLLEACLAEVLG